MDAKDQKYGYKKRRGSFSSSSSSASSRYVPYSKRPRLYKSLISTKAIKAPKTFRETINYGDVELKTGLTATAGVINFKVSQLGNFSTLSGAFDTYSVRKIKVDFIPYGMQVFNTASATNGLPSTSGVSPLHTVIDYDDANNLSSVNAALEYATCKYAPTGRRITRTYTPKTLTQIYESAISSGYSGKANQWIDVAQDDVPCLGLKWILTYPAPGANILMYKIYVTVTYLLKDQR